MGNYTIFRCSKILGEAGKQEILQQMFRKSRSQMTLGALIITTTVLLEKNCVMSSGILLKEIIKGQRVPDPLNVLNYFIN